MITANLSGGRDSTAMVVRWLELGNKIDHIIFCNTHYEFDEMYEYINKLDKYLQDKFNMQITRLDSGDKIKEYAFIKPITKGEREDRFRGLPITLGRDYCTRETKINPTTRFIKERSPNKFNNVALIGYTYNEVENGRNSNLDYATARYPLHEWKWNEAEVEAYLRDKGIANPLYERFSRTGCFLCPKQSLKSLYQVYKYYNDKWEIMKQWEARAKELNCVNQTWKIGVSLLELEAKFKTQSEDLFTDSYDLMETCFCK